MDKIAERLKKQKDEEKQERKKPLEISNTQVQASTVVWIIGVFILDLITAYIVWQVTGYWFYGVMWMLIGAGGLTWSEWLQHRIGNNFKQREIASTGVLVSAIAVGIMALVSGAFWILGRNDSWIAVMFEIVTVCLFLFHMVQAYRYRMIDDGYIERNLEARSKERHEADLRRIERAKKELQKAMEAEKLEQEFIKEHGQAAMVALGLDVKPANKPASVDPQNPPK